MIGKYYLIWLNTCSFATGITINQNLIQLIQVNITTYAVTKPTSRKVISHPLYDSHKSNALRTQIKQPVVNTQNAALFFLSKSPNNFNSSIN